MDGKRLLKLGYKPGKAVGLALEAARAARAEGASEDSIVINLTGVLTKPGDYADHPIFGPVAAALMAHQEQPEGYNLNTPAPYRVWGAEQIEPEAFNQLRRAVRLPVAVKGALMPDAHQGYGLPIGGVLATHNSVIPYAVGVDIACRMKMTVFDVSPNVFGQKREKFRQALERNTLFGPGVEWDKRRDHEVMDNPAWAEHPIARRYRDVAWRQLGSSGSGNHFVEFGELEVHEEIDSPLGKIPAGKYVALLSHSGSRRFGMEMADYYTKVAMDQRARLPKDFIHLAWLDLDDEAGAEYWEAMTLAGLYASANHAVIHRQVIEAMRMPVLGGIENHHNFAWKEIVDGHEAIVHRKGATPASEGVLGVIPGSMSAPGYVVRGLGNAESLSSAAHGAGRRMSRHEAIKKFEWKTVQRLLKDQGVELISAGLDESPGAYKDIRRVMADQADLVAVLAEFRPRLVKMDAGRKNLGGERLD